jgi:hypothetical protein
MPQSFFLSKDGKFIPLLLKKMAFNGSGKNRLP